MRLTLILLFTLTVQAGPVKQPWLTPAPFCLHRSGTLEIPTTPGRRYLVETSHDLREWRELVWFQGTGQTEMLGQWLDGHCRFYRVWRD